MYLITATFDVEQAHAKAAELLALGDTPDRLAERLGSMHDLPMVKEGVPVASFKKLIDEVTRLKQFIALEKQIAELKAGKSMVRFLGSGFKEKQIAKLEEERRKFGSLIEAPRWFYKQPRVRLLSAIRDYALDGSQQGDAVWTDIDEKKLVFPIVNIFESADVAEAQALAGELEKPLKDIAPRFLLEKFEGNRSINFDLEKGVAIYYAPVSGSSGS
jgi:hypothetical protein